MTMQTDNQRGKPQRGDSLWRNIAVTTVLFVTFWMLIQISAAIGG